MTLKEVNEFRNEVDKYFYRNGGPKKSLGALKNIVTTYGPIKLSHPNFSFKIYIEDDKVINEVGNKRVEVDESDSISFLELLHTFRDDLEIHYTRKFCAMSDLHGNLVDFDRSVDYVLIGGDICPEPIEKVDNEKWFIENFIPWVKSIDSIVIFIAGNHDKFLHNNENLFKTFPENLVYLENEFYIDENIEIFGTPLCRNMLDEKSNNPFFVFDEESKKIWEGLEFDNLKIRKKIVLSHDAPYGVSDVAENPEPYLIKEEHLGNKSLRDLILTMKPDINLHGHIHSSNHDSEFIEDTEIRCISLLDEDMNVAYEPLYFEI